MKTERSKPAALKCGMASVHVVWDAKLVLADIKLPEISFGGLLFAEHRDIL